MNSLSQLNRMAHILSYAIILMALIPSSLQQFNNCGNLDDIGDGQYTDAACTVGDQTAERLCVFTCSEGFTPMGEYFTLDSEKVFYRRCKTDNAWTAVQCTRVVSTKNCDNADPVRGAHVNENIIKSTGIEMEFYTYTCSQGYSPPEHMRFSEGQGRGIGICYNGQFEDAVCDQDCNTLEKPQNVLPSSEFCFGPKYSKRCLYLCTAGSKLSQAAETLKLGENIYGVAHCVAGEWQEPQCLFNGCVLPSLDQKTARQHSSPKKITLIEGESIEYSCTTPLGYFMPAAGEDVEFLPPKMRLKCVTNELKRVFFEDYEGESNIVDFEEEKIMCVKNCASLSIKYAAYTEGECLLGQKYKHRATCIASCAFGHFVQFGLDTINLECIDSEWVSGMTTMNSSLQCPNFPAEFGEVGPTTSMDTPVYKNCFNFATDPMVNRLCKVNAQDNKVYCSIFCPEGNFNEFDNLSFIYMRCDEDNMWHLHRDISDVDEFGSLSKGVTLSCSPKCEPLEFSTDMYFSNFANCARGQSAISGQICELQCRNKIFTKYEENHNRIKCFMGKWNLFDGEQYSPLRSNTLPFNCEGEVDVPTDTCRAPEPVVGVVFDSESCVDGSANQSSCTFTCENPKAKASPHKGGDCSPNKGVIRCNGGQWEQASCSKGCSGILPCGGFPSININFNFMRSQKNANDKKCSSGSTSKNCLPAQSGSSSSGDSKNSSPAITNSTASTNGTTKKSAAVDVVWIAKLCVISLFVVF